MVLERQEKKISRWQAGVVVLLLLAVLLGTLGCGKEKDEARNKPQERKPFLVQNQENVMVYFSTTDGKNLIPITLSINPTEEVAKVAVEKLLAGPENDFSLPTIPEGTKLKDLYLQTRTVYVDLTGEINSVSPDKAETAINSLVMTLTEFNEVDDVQILVDGRIQENIGGVKTGEPLKRPKALNNYGGEGDSLVKVFFSDGNAMYLVPVTYKVSGNNLPLTAIKKLLNGPPEKSGLLRTIWSGTKIKEFSVNDGVAAIDFSKEALGYGGGTTAETMFVNSVILTLTQFEDIDAVQFMFEGNKIDFLPEGSDVSSPIYGTKKINLIK